MSETTSVHFINRLREGNETHSWNRFCEIYDPFILGWLLRQGVRDCDAADIRQEVMCTVLCELPKFRHNGSLGAFRCWLRLVTVNELRRFRRRHRRERILSQFGREDQHQARIGQARANPRGVERLGGGVRVGHGVSHPILPTAR